jgi:hypothetical protein
MICVFYQRWPRHLGPHARGIFCQFSWSWRKTWEGKGECPLFWNNSRPRCQFLKGSRIGCQNVWGAPIGCQVLKFLVQHTAVVVATPMVLRLVLAAPPARCVWSISSFWVKSHAMFCATSESRSEVSTAKLQCSSSITDIWACLLGSQQGTHLFCLQFALPRH